MDLVKFEEKMPVMIKKVTTFEKKEEIYIKPQKSTDKQIPDLQVKEQWKYTITQKGELDAAPIKNAVSKYQRNINHEEDMEQEDRSGWNGAVENYTNQRDNEQPKYRRPNRRNVHTSNYKKSTKYGNTYSMTQTENYYY